MARAGQYNQSNAGRLLVLIVGLSRLRRRVKISDIRYFLGRHFSTAARIMRKSDGQNDDGGKRESGRHRDHHGIDGAQRDELLRVAQQRPIRKLMTKVTTEITATLSD
jgi:hypothetical protein